MVWLNDDGLTVKFGTEEADAGKGGAYSTLGALRMAEVEITGTSIASTATLVDRHTIIPSGARIEKVEVVAETAFTSGGAATLDVGLVDQDETTAIDDDGLVAALALTSIDADGDVVELVQGSTGHGALVGTTTSNAGYLTVHYGTAAYTAGVGKVRVYYYIP